MAMRRLRVRAAEDGFTMTEMLVVLLVLGLLMAIAVPSYLGFSGRAETGSAAADVRTAVSSAEGYHTDHATYASMTIDALREYDSGVDVDHVKVSADGRSYCLDKTVGGRSAYVIRGAAPHTPAVPDASAGQVDETGVCPATVSDTSN